MSISSLRSLIGRATATLAMTLALAFPVLAEVSPPPLVTDRPDQTESSVVVTKGFVQIESGYGFSRFDLAGETLEVTSFPSTLVRYGLDSNVELRVGWSGYVNEELEIGGIDTDRSGSGATTLGAKVYLRDEGDIAPRMALLVNVDLPTGDSALRSDRIDPSARLLGSHTLSDRVGLGWNAGIAATTGDDAGGETDTFAAGVYTASLAIGINDRWGSFIELYGGIPLSGPDGPANAVDAGLTYLVQDNLQFDISAGAGLSDAADDWIMGVGISFRLPR